MIHILIADDHDVVRRGLTLILESRPGMKVVSSCARGTEALSWLRRNDCDIAIIDIAMPDLNGIDLLGHLRKDKPRLPVLILSAYPEDQYAVRLIKAGASGYMNKNCAPDEIAAAVQNLLAGKRYVSPAVVEMLANELCVPDGRPPHETLSNREHQIFMLLASAKTYAEIAETLKLSVKTVSTYRNRILEKMQLQNNAELMRYAISRDLMPRP